MGAVRVVVTGAPGAGKTTVLDLLASRGWTVVPEAATEVNEQLAAAGAGEAWRAPDFLDRIVALQLERERAAGEEGVHLLDRSVVCTLALARYLGLPAPDSLRAALDRVEAEGRYERRVLLVRPVGRVRRSVARRISYEDSLRFERVHVSTYRDLGYELVDVPLAPSAERADRVEALLSSWGLDGPT